MSIRTNYPIEDRRSEIDSDLLDTLTVESQRVLEELYAAVTPRLESQFSHLRRAATDQLQVWDQLLSWLGEIAPCPPPSPDPEPAGDSWEVRVAWRPVARQTVLALVHVLVARHGERYSSSLLADETAKALDRERFVRTTALPESDVDLAVRVAAEGLLSSMPLLVGRAMLFRGAPCFIQSDGNELHATALDPDEIISSQHADESVWVMDPETFESVSHRYVDGYRPVLLGEAREIAIPIAIVPDPGHDAPRTSALVSLLRQATARGLFGKRTLPREGETELYPMSTGLLQAHGHVEDEIESRHP